MRHAASMSKDHAVSESNACEGRCSLKAPQNENKEAKVETGETGKKGEVRNAAEG